jgi:hypothetical protein
MFYSQLSFVIMGTCYLPARVCQECPRVSTPTYRSLTIFLCLANTQQTRNRHLSAVGVTSGCNRHIYWLAPSVASGYNTSMSSPLDRHLPFYGAQPGHRRPDFLPCSQGSYLVPIQKWPICPKSALREKFNPRYINLMPLEDPEPIIGAVRFFVRLDRDQVCEGTIGARPFPDRHSPNPFLHFRKGPYEPKQSVCRRYQCSAG